MSSLKQREYNWILKLMRRQKAMLAKNDVQLLELYKFCDNEEQRNLLEELIVRFNCFDPDLYAAAIQDAVNYIDELGFIENETALVAFCHDGSADSSQVVLDDMKVPMAIKGYSRIKTINRFDRIIHEYNKSCGKIKHFIAVDEFVGSGKTLSLRADEFNRLIPTGATINFVFLAGMREAIEVGKALGESVYVVYEMDKGITAYYDGEQLELKRSLMRSLEGKLAPRINKTDLTDYHFGYHGTEALYCRPNKNVPNNVFPIFWWKEDKDGKPRKTVLIRVQNDY